MGKAAGTFFLADVVSSLGQWSDGGYGIFEFSVDIDEV